MTITDCDLETLPACVICGGKLFTVMTVPDASYEQLVLQQCKGCGITLQNPRLTHAAMLAMENESTVYDFSPAEVEWTVSGPLDGLTASFERFVRSPGKRWLDIGCNRGMLLEAARRRGWQVIGIEIADEAAQRARTQFGLTVYPDLTAIAHEPLFDVITAWHVLEHTYDPVAFLAAAEAKLTPGGVLALQVPAFEHLDDYRARGQFAGIVCAVHNFYFTEATLRQVVAHTALQPLHFVVDPDILLLTAICTKPLPAEAAPHLWQRLRTFLHLNGVLCGLFAVQDPG
jgi:SAM-dependent methyltransferase